MATGPQVPDRKEGMMNPQYVSLDGVREVLGKGNRVVHFGSHYGDKNIPIGFVYSDVSLEVALAELDKYRIQPRLFTSPEGVAKFMSENSNFVTDTYVLELPGDVFVVYQLTNIREFAGDFIKKYQPRIDGILGLKNNHRKGPFDERGFIRSEWIGFDGLWQPKGERLDYGNLIKPTGPLLKSIDQVLEIQSILARWEGDKEEGRGYILDKGPITDEYKIIPNTRNEPPYK